MICVDPPAELTEQPPAAIPETAPQRQPNRWRYRFPWVKTAVGAPLYDDELLIDNRTPHAFALWHAYHALGVVDAHSQRTVRLVKSGLLSARQLIAPPGADYLLISLNPEARGVAICDISGGGEGYYDLRLLGPGELRRPRLPETAGIEQLQLSASIEKALKQAEITTVERLKQTHASYLHGILGEDSQVYLEIWRRLREHGWD